MGLFGREALFGTALSITELSAARHALAQGFLLPLMFSMASRLLPVYSADVLRHRGCSSELTIDLLLVGALCVSAPKPSAATRLWRGYSLLLAAALAWLASPCLLSECGPRSAACPSQRGRSA